MTAGLRQPASGIHCRRAQSHQQSSCTNQGEGLLLGDGAVDDRPKDVGIKPSLSRQLLSIDPGRSYGHYARSLAARGRSPR